mmetsp:Transcript_60828/g.189006  ORF Transcript_60828/g.189006 Transcript_60828/m.189006 type:complete len:201 (+) Transcript_60828:803-1405(+)
MQPPSVRGLALELHGEAAEAHLQRAALRRLATELVCEGPRLGQHGRAVAGGAALARQWRRRAGPSAGVQNRLRARRLQVPAQRSNELPQPRRLCLEVLALGGLLRPDVGDLPLRGIAVHLSSLQVGQQFVLARRGHRPAALAPGAAGTGLLLVCWQEPGQRLQRVQLGWLLDVHYPRGHSHSASVARRSGLTGAGLQGLL